jgi:hypothetical protein
MSILYDSTELLGATYIPRYVQHETAPDRLINSIKLARQDGEVIVDDTMAVKYIDVVGVLVGTSRSDLDDKIDAFKELISRKDKNLDLTWGAGTRRYVCRSIKHEFKRDHYHTSHVPYSIRFFVPTGYGKDTSSTNVLNKTGGTAITATTSTAAVTFAGSYKPKPVHRITINTRGNADVIRVENTDTGDYMDVDLLTVDANGFTNGDYFEIDEENQTVKKNGTTNLNYRGKFPSVVPGVNNLKVTVIGSGSTLDVNIDVVSATEANFVNAGWNSAPRGAQSFIPAQSGRIYKLKPSVARHQNGGLGGKLSFWIVDDNNGIPGANYSTDDFTIPYANVPDTIADDIDALYEGADADRPFVIKGKRYWVYLLPTSISGGDANNHYIWRINNVPATYANGKAMFYKTSYIDGYADASEVAGGIASQCDMAIEIYMGGDGGAASHNIDWKVDYVKKFL